jgi:twitching motility protein PilJ
MTQPKPELGNPNRENFNTGRLNLEQQHPSDVPVLLGSMLPQNKGQDKDLETNILTRRHLQASQPLAGDTPKVYRGVALDSRDREGDASLLSWFYNLPIRGKQWAALLTSQALSLLGLAGVGALLLVASGRSQLENQSKSELALTGINYFIKVNQMGFGFRGQSDNVAVIEAARKHLTGVSLTPEAQNQVTRILKNEVKARNIEYATLVGRDKKIIASANANREGEVFDPNNLVSKVLANPQQLKATAVVPWSELKTEDPPLPPGFSGKDALIRYTATAVFDPGNKQVIGVLVSGDIVNGKTPITEGTLKSFDGGYSAVYYQLPKGNFAIANSLQSTGEKTGEKIVSPNIALPKEEILRQAIAANGKAVAARQTIGNQTYTVSAQALPSLFVQQAKGPVPVANSKPVAILVRGTPETALNNLLRSSLYWLLPAIGLILLINLGLVKLLEQAIADPLKKLQSITRKFAEGDRKVRAEVLAPDEVGNVASAFNYLADNISQSEQLKEIETRNQEFLTGIAIARNSETLTPALNAFLEEVRRDLNLDRMVVYRFLPSPNPKAYIAGEAVLPGWPSALRDNIEDACISMELRESYRQGRTVVMPNIAQSDLNPAHADLLERLRVKASLIVPIVQGENLFGLAIAHHCEGPHEWQTEEIDYLRELIPKLAQALYGLLTFELEQGELEREQKRYQTIQNELLTLLSDVEGATTGDLTVRAEVSSGQIGIVADFFNAIVENLRDIVQEVKQASNQVNHSVGENEASVRQLAAESLRQAEQISSTLNAVEEITQSINNVALNAQTAAQISRTAFSQAETGGEAMDRTVESILQLRDTVSETTKKVKRLGEASQQISKVISLINQIALKTNLLAVNASIEAARAGEEGRGFAVVAEEVGELAAQSATATREIEQIVETIQRETNEVVEAMEVGTSQVIEGTRLVETTKQSLGQIVSVSRQIDQLLQSISSATVSQTQKSDTVTHLIKETAKISEKTAISSNKVSDSLQSTVEIARQLQASVETFKVSE